MTRNKGTIFSRGMILREANRSLKLTKKPGMKTLKVLKYGRFTFDELTTGQIRKDYPRGESMKILRQRLEKAETVLIPYVYFTFENNNEDDNHAIAVLYKRESKSVEVFDCIMDYRRFKILNKDLRRTFRSMGLPLKKVKMVKSPREWPVLNGCCLMPLCLAEQIYSGEMIHWPTDKEVWKMYDLVHSDNFETLDWVPHTS